MTQPASQNIEAPPESARESLPRSTILAYCLPMVGVGFMAMPFYVWLMKYSTDVLLIAPAAIGSIFFIGRFWDAISDPIAGYLSDLTTSNRGRRRSWMVAAAIPLGLTTVMLWSPPWMLEGLALVLWMGEGIDRSDHFDTQGSLYLIYYFSIRGQVRVYLIYGIKILEI